MANPLQSIVVQTLYMFEWVINIFYCVLQLRNVYMFTIISEFRMPNIYKHLKGYYLTYKFFLKKKKNIQILFSKLLNLWYTVLFRYPYGYMLQQLKLWIVEVYVKQSNYIDNFQLRIYVRLLQPKYMKIPNSMNFNNFYWTLIETNNLFSDWGPT